MKKKISYILMAALALGFAACSDQNEVVDDLIDGIEERPVVKSFPYTLTADDYSTISAAAATAAGDNADNKALADAVKATNSLNSFASPLTYMDNVLGPKFPALGIESAIQVTYNYTPDYLAGLTANPPSGDIIMGEDFNAMTLNGEVTGWTQFDKTGTKKWLIKTYNQNNFAEVTSFGDPKEKNDIWLVSPEIDLSGITEAAVMFGAEVRYPVTNHKYLKVWVSEDFDSASPETASWTELTSSFTLPAAQTGASASAGAASLNDFAGGKVNIAFEYTGDGTANPALTTTFRLDDFRVAEGEIITPNPGEVFINDPEAGWVVYENGISLSTGDFEAMGVEQLYPDTAPNYLPVFLAQKYPYAQEGDRKAVLYGSEADEYIFTGGKWSPTIVGAPITEQYVNDGEKWIFDPTVKFTMASADHQLMVDWVKDNKGVEYLDSYGTSEYWFGYASFYNNVSFRLSYRESLVDEDLHDLNGDAAAQAALLWDRLQNEGMPLLLQMKYPNSPAISQGVQLYYNITVPVYYPDCETNATKHYMMRYKVLTAGSGSTPPTFEFVSTTEL
jgi:hypothetical protein